MAKCIDEAYVAPYYYYWAKYDDGSIYIYNDSANYIHEKYGDEWDRLRKYDSNGDWSYIYDANGNHPTVSGNGANLPGGSGNDTIYNDADYVKIDASTGNDYISNGVMTLANSSGITLQ